jgi:DNA polymerase
VSTLHIDFETRSAVDLKKTGVHVYAEDETTDVWCAAYAVDDGDIKLWHPDLDDRDIRHAISNTRSKVAHNAAFERTVWRSILTPRYGWPKIDDEWRCTMAQALAMSLPGSLENAAAAVGITAGKDMDGHRLMMRMARPRSRNADGSFVWWDVPERKARLYEYCINDVKVERLLDERLRRLPPSEQSLWILDQKINDRGVYVDLPFCEAARKLVDDTMRRLNSEMLEVTDRAVKGVTRVAELTAFVSKRYGDEAIKSIAKGELTELLARGDLPPEVRRALEIRQEGGKASVAKIDALVLGRSERTGRARGLVQYHAASTGRWGGRRFQPQNLKRPDEETNIDEAIADILAGRTSRTIEWLHGPPLSVVGDCIRGMVRAAPGNKFYVADFVSIEGVVLPWLAGEEWKLDAFRDYRAGKAPDLYIQGYCKTFRVPLFDKKDPRRQIGKVMELASGFGGGHGAYLKMGATGKKLEDLTKIVMENTPKSVWAEASEKYETGRKQGLPEDQWVALRVVIDAWRAAHPRIKQLWYDLEDAAISAVRKPGEVFMVGGGDRPALAFKKQGSFLWLRLPSGRLLCYPYPRVETKTTPWGAEKQVLITKGVNSFTRKFVDGNPYGGLLAENATQAVARDILAEAIVRCESEGYPVVMHVHDEVVCETKESSGSQEDFMRCMETAPKWAQDCPIAAEGWEGFRYRKAA